MSRRRDILAASGTLLVILVVLVLGFLRLGSPQRQRGITADQRRARDLYGIANDIHENHAFQLPERLEELKPERWGESLKDPVTGVSYEYHPKGGRAYELCATFSGEGLTLAEWDSREGEPMGRFQKHPGGRYCYQLDASQPLYY
jgi:hypothetical protein